MIIKALGQGQFGKAYICHHEDEEETQTHVLKQMDLNLLNEHDMKAAILEAELLRKLSSPCIVKYIDSFVIENKLSIVMEHCDGGDLETLIEMRKKNNQLFQEGEIKNVLCQIAIALEYCHDRNIFHRDIKTQNIFLCKNGRVKLGDFGVSKQMNDSNMMAQTQTGTPYYLSPEICNGEGYGSKSDIWALGIIVYEMMNFHLPFNERGLGRLVRSITNSNFEPLSPKYSNSMRQLVEQMLSKTPKTRPASSDILSCEALANTTTAFAVLRKKPTDLEDTTVPATAQYKDIMDEVDNELNELESKHINELNQVFEKYSD